MLVWRRMQYGCRFHGVDGVIIKFTKHFCCYDFNTIVNKTSDSFEYEACMLGLGGGAPDPYAGKDILMSGGRMHFWNPQQPEAATPWEARIDELMREVGRHTDVKIRKKYFKHLVLVPFLDHQNIHLTMSVVSIENYCFFFFRNFSLLSEHSASVVFTTIFSSLLQYQ